MSAFNNDTLKNKYELNDPRNSNCPCHKYQKLADEEFKKLNKNNIIGMGNSNSTPTQIVSSKLSGSGIKKKYFKNIIVFHHKNKTYKFLNFNIGHGIKKRHLFKNNKNMSSCFSWR